MKRHQGLVTLSREHHKNLLMAQVLKKDAPPYRGMPTDVQGKKELLEATYEEEIIPHFKKEEEILFPEVKGMDAKVDDLIGELTEEHRRIEAYVKQIIKEEHPLDSMDELGYLLEAHIRKEERDLFERLQEIMDDDQLLAFRDKF